MESKREKSITLSVRLKPSVVAALVRRAQAQRDAPAVAARKLIEAGLERS